MHRVACVACKSQCEAPVSSAYRSPQGVPTCTICTACASGDTVASLRSDVRRSRIVVLLVPIAAAVGFVLGAIAGAVPGLL